MMIEHRLFALSCTACLFTVGCGRLADVEDREGFSTYADDDGDGDDNDDLGEEPGSAALMNSTSIKLGWLATTTHGGGGRRCSCDGSGRR